MNRTRLPKDTESADDTTENLKTSQHGMYEKGRLDKTTRSHSLAPSYRLSDLDISQLARELLVMQEDASPVKQGAKEHGEGQEAHKEKEGQDPFGDDTYAIGDEEVDNIVGVLRDSRDMADDSTSRITQSVNGGDGRLPYDWRRRSGRHFGCLAYFDRDSCKHRTTE